MGSAGRLNSGKCLRCGDILILGPDDYPIAGPYQCCTACTAFLENERRAVKNKVEKGTLNTKNVVNSRQLLRPTKSMGKPLEGEVVFWRN